MNTLYLFPAEQTVFDSLSADLKDGWSVEAEEKTYEDSAQKRAIRLSMARVHDPVLMHLRDKAYKAGTVEEVAGYINETDLKRVDEDDIAELFFALGPDIIGRLIAYMLQTAKTDTDIEGIVSLSLIRHEIYQSFAPSAR